MKIYIGKPRYHWFSPYTVLALLFWWQPWSRSWRAGPRVYDQKHVPDPDWLDRWADRLNPISQWVQKVLDWVHPRIDYVRIDPWDTWSMDHTLSRIILPMLKQLREKQHGAPNTDDSDVPESLRSTAAPPKTDSSDVDPNHFARWDWILDEMIWAFEMHSRDDWDEEFWSGQADYVLVPVDSKGQEVAKPDAPYFSMKRGLNHTLTCDHEARDRAEARMKNGLRLFGKYYGCLWD